MLENIGKFFEQAEKQEVKEEEKVNRLEELLQIEKTNKVTMDLLREELLASKLERERQNNKEEPLLIQRFEEDFSHEDFKFCYLVVSSADEGKRIYFNKSGVVYSQALSEGVNKVLMGRGTRVKSDTEINVVKILSNYEL